MTNKNGDYVYDGLTRKVQSSAAAPVVVKKREPVQHRQRNITELADVVTSWPEFPGGGAVFLKYLDEMGKSMVSKLPDGRTKANIMIEFIVDVDGIPTNFKVLNGVDEDFNDELITILEQMPAWTPAMINEKVVAKKMKQSFVIE